MKPKCTNENVMLSVDVLHRHPQNPRKGVGDVTELADSIKKNGVMQNLTVIPGYWDGSGNHHDEEYTLLIGHRRFTAAKLAGITELPCRIIEGMSEKEQMLSHLLFLFVRKMGLEPTQRCRHKILSLARLPIPTLPRSYILSKRTRFATKAIIPQRVPSVNT